MSFGPTEASVSNAQPVFLLQFTRQTKTWRFCTSADSVTHLGQEYDAVGVRVGRIQNTGDTFKDSATITFPRGNEFAAQYLGRAADELTSVTILRGHQYDGDYVVWWKGRIMTTTTTARNEITLNCQTIFSSLRRPGLRDRIEYTCTRALYDGKCKVSRSTHEAEGIVATILDGGYLIEVPEAAVLGDNYYTAGIVSIGLNQRFVTSQVGVQMRLSRPFEIIGPGTIVKIYPGCDHLLATCRDKFGNLNNAMMFPWVPTRNPFTGSIV